MSADVILARATKAGQVRPEALSRVEVPVLLINGSADAADQETGRLLGLFRNGRRAKCDGDRRRWI